MNTSLLINKKSVQNNSNLKNAKKQEKRLYGKGNGKYLKNYLGKIVSFADCEPVHEKLRITNFVTDISKEKLLAEIKAAQITGMSGNGFPLYQKITTFLACKEKSKVLLINAVECDPALLHDRWLINNRYSEIVETANYLKKIFGLEKVVLAATISPAKDGLDFAIVPPRYPMGEEHFLIRQAFGVHLEKKNIPAERGFLVLNVQSVYQIGKIMNGCYDGGRFITIADLTTAAAKIAYVNTDDNISKIMIKNFGAKGKKLLYKGFGAMASINASETDNFSIQETFAAYANPQIFDNKNRCKRCGSCKRKCPSGVEIAKIVQAVDNGKDINYPACRIEHCVQCGSCTYFCPALKNVAEYVPVK